MKTILAAAFVAACLAPGAFADAVTFAPGLWAYDGQAMLGAATLTDSGQECMAPGENSYDLAEVARSIADGCALTSASPVENGYDFAIACTGGVRGELAGRIEIEGGQAELTAQGWTGAPDTPLTLNVSARATRLADSC
mgnify:CR=1 FL=1